jgi:periplasmic divalent cation tolerance protein
MEEYIQVTTTADTKETAEKIATVLVQKRLAACVQIVGPISSVYWWKGKVEKTNEWLCIVKTRKNLYEAVEASIKANHTYEVPEIIAVPIVEGSKGYISWLDEELGK